MRNYSKHRKGHRVKRTRRLSGGMFGMFKRKPAAAAAASGEPDVGDIDSHEKGVADKLKAADAALVAAQQAQQRLQQEQANTAKCASKVKEVIKQKSASAQTRVSDIKKEVDTLTEQLTKLNAQKKETDKAFAEANKTLSAVNASSKAEFKKCLENPDNYNLSIPNIEPTSGVPTPEDPNQLGRSQERTALAGIQAPEPAAPPNPFGGKKRRRKSKKHKRKSKKHTKSRRH